MLELSWGYLRAYEPHYTPKSAMRHSHHRGIMWFRYRYAYVIRVHCAYCVTTRISQAVQPVAHAAGFSLASSVPRGVIAPRDWHSDVYVNQDRITTSHYPVERSCEPTS
jgi:hypothetical protein